MLRHFRRFFAAATLICLRCAIAITLPLREITRAAADIIDVFHDCCHAFSPPLRAAAMLILRFYIHAVDICLR